VFGSRQYPTSFESELKSNKKDVLLAVVNPGSPYSQTSESSIAAQPCNVYHAVLGWIFLRKETLFDMQPSVFDCFLFALLQLSW